MASEKNFENKIKQFLQDEGCWFIKYWSGSSSSGKTFTKEGIPDILCCCNGYFVGIEVKAPNGKPSLLQLHNLKKIDQAGGYGILLYPDMWDDFKDFIHLEILFPSTKDHDMWYASNVKFQEEWKRKVM